MRFIDFFDRSASNHPERVFVRAGGLSATYRQAQEISNRVANALRAHGVNPGSKAVVLSEGSLAACFSILGLMRAGCIWTTLGTTTAAQDIIANLNRVSVDVVFCSPKYKETILDIRDQCDNLRQVVYWDADGLDAMSWYVANASTSSPEITCRPDDIATLFTTGGSTGEPKNAIASFRSWETGFANLVAMTPQEGTVHGLVLPLSHIAGGTALQLAMALAGTVVLEESFDPERLARSISEHRVSQIALPPAGIKMMLSHPRVRDFDFSSLRTLIYAGAPCAGELIVEALDVFGAVLATSFGQTETTVPVTASLPRDHVAALDANDLKRLSSCGRTLPASRVEIMDERGEFVKRGNAGEIVVRGNHIMVGYYEDPQGTEEVSRFGWHHTGDIGVMDEEGYLYIVGRKREMIITSGYNVFPSQIEATLSQHPAVRECVVVGAPHDILGEVVKAVVVLSENRGVSERELKKFCRERIGPIKTPVSIEFWKTLPRTNNGKLARASVREAFWNNSARRI